MWNNKVVEENGRRRGEADIGVGVGAGEPPHVAVVVGSASENTWLGSSSSSSPTYKLVAAAQSSQSVLNAVASVACLIVVSLTTFWTVLYTSFFLPTWNIICSIIFIPSDQQQLLIIKQEEEEKQQQPGSENNLITTKMTIAEVPADVTPPSAALPVLRINSMNMDDPLLASHFILSSSASEGEDVNEEQIFSDSELSSGNEGGGDGGQLQMQLIRRDSDASDNSSMDGSQEDTKEEDSVELAAKIIAQVENMFSDDHLAKDGFLLKHVRRRSDGFVSLKLVAGLRKVKQISREFNVVMTALRKSNKLEVNDEGTKIRRVESLTSYLKSLPVATQNKDKDKLSKSPSSSGDDLPSRNTNNNGSYLHQFSCGFPVTIEKENRRQQQYGGRNGRNSQRNSKDLGPKEQQQLQQQLQHHREQQHKQVHRQSYNNSNNNKNNKNHHEEVVLRRRGGSLPISVGSGSQQRERPNSSHLSPNSSPPTNNYLLPQRPKSNSYCEGLTTSATMSPWLQRRKAASRTNSEGNVIITSVIRQPRGPDGSRGFALAVPRLPCIPAH